MTETAPSDVVDEDDLTDDELLDSEGPAVEVRGLTSAFGENVVHQGPVRHAGTGPAVS